MRKQLAARLASFTVLAFLLVGLPACTNGQREAVLQLGRGATSKVFGSLGRETGEIKAVSSQVPQLAARYGASADEVAAVAGTADNYQGWQWPQESIDQMAATARQAKDNKFVSGGVSVACDWMAGKIKNSAQFQGSVTSAMVGMAANQQAAFRSANTDLAQKLEKIRSDGTEKDKAAAVWLCYAYQATP